VTTSDAPKRRLPRKIQVDRIVLLVLVLAVAYLLYGQVATQIDANEATQEAEAVQERAEDAVNPVDQLCAEGGAIAAELERRGACEKARELLDAPPPKPVAVGPSQEDIEAAVADHLVEHPPPAGRPPTVAEITSAVAEYLTAHPPRPGRPPTPTEIATAVADYLTANPPSAGQDGADGVDGADAPAPTAEQIAAAVNDWLEANPPPPGPSGPAGPAGPEGPPGPICPDGYTAMSRRYDPSPMPGDEETWWVCVQDPPADGG
jgi:hypothetical protein